MNKWMNGVLRHKMGIASMAYSASRQHHLFPAIGPERREPLSEYRFKGMQLVGKCCIPCRLSGWIKRFVNKTFEGLDNIHTNLHKFLQPFIRYCSGWMDRKLNLIIINKSKIKFYVNCSLIKPKWSIQHEQPQRSS